MPSDNLTKNPTYEEHHTRMTFPVDAQDIMRTNQDLSKIAVLGFATPEIIVEQPHAEYMTNPYLQKFSS